MSKRNLLLCFDAFGTLFAPKRPVHHQYSEVAHALGLRGFTEEDVQRSFKAAFKHEAAEHPNFGKASGMNAEKWWTNIIRNTFQPLIPPDQKLPEKLVPKLLHRFWSNEGYTLADDVQLVLDRLRGLDGEYADRVVIGVITNSDDRVPDILTSLGLSVSPLRFGDELSGMNASRDRFDIDFTIMSFDVGHEKPDKRIFAAAEETLQTALIAQGHDVTSFEPADWQKVYFGDEYAKDVEGALAAGWNAVLIGPYDGNAHPKLQSLDDHTAGKFSELFGAHPAVGFNSFGKLSEWLR